MASGDLYSGLAANTGGFITPVPGGSSNAGYYQQGMNLPFYSGRSLLTTIPEYMRNPLSMEKDILYKISEGRQNFMKLLLEQANVSGYHEVNDVRYRLPIEIEPQGRIYLAVQSVTCNSTTKLSTITVKGNTTKINTANPLGNIKQVGDIARLEVGQMALLMCSWVDPKRTLTPSYANSAYIASSSGSAAGTKPLPELVKIVSVDYVNSKFTCYRNWAGEQRTVANLPTTPGTFGITTSATPEVIADTGGTGTVWEANAFIVPMAKSMKEDEIDAKIQNYTSTYTWGMLQRDLRAWGSSRFAEVIAGNMGMISPASRSKKLALNAFYDGREWQGIFGEKSESFDAATGYWSGTTDGLLANIPTSHYLNIKDVDWNATTLTAGASTGFGTFHPTYFNKMLQGKGLMGSQSKVLLCGGNFHTSFATMINFMTQQVPSIQSSWEVKGKDFTTSEELHVQVVPSDKMTMNGMSNSAILFDKASFKATKLRGYPAADVHEIQNENPLKTNGFIHGVFGFIDLNPDNHWVFNLVPHTDSAYASMNPIGEPLA